MDDRFAHVFKDPRFQQVPVKERKLKIDKRFKGMFNDKRFNLKYTVDKRGRPINTSTSENLQKYYELSDDDDDEEMDESESSSEDKKKEKSKKKKEKKKKKTVEKEKKLVSNGVKKCETKEIINSKKITNDSLIKNQKTKTLEKDQIDKTDLQRKRKLSPQDTEWKTEKKVKKQSKKEIEKTLLKVCIGLEHCFSVEVSVGAKGHLYHLIRPSHWKWGITLWVIFIYTFFNCVLPIRYIPNIFLCLCFTLEKWQHSGMNIVNIMYMWNQ